MHIDSYSFGSMTVDGREYTSDLILLPEGVRSNWWRREGHSLSMEDLKEVMEYKPEVLIVGKGASGCMDIPASTREALKDAHIELIDKDTDSAYVVFNEAIRTGRKVAGVFHLTC